MKITITNQEIKVSGAKNLTPGFWYYRCSAGILHVVFVSGIPTKGRECWNNIMAVDSSGEPYRVPTSSLNTREFTKITGSLTIEL
jgi:hypothetical protein